MPDPNFRRQAAMGFGSGYGEKFPMLVRVSNFRSSMRGCFPVLEKDDQVVSQKQRNLVIVKVKEPKSIAYCGQVCLAVVTGTGSTFAVVF